MKEPDPENINKNGLINLDILLLIIINKYKSMKKRVMQYTVHIFNIFEVVNCEGERIIDLYSFLLLFRYIESFLKIKKYFFVII